MDCWNLWVRSIGRWRKKLQTASRNGKTCFLRRTFSSWRWCVLRAHLDSHYSVLVETAVNARKTRVLHSIIRLLSLKVTHQQHIREKWAQLLTAAHSSLQRHCPADFKLVGLRDTFRKSYLRKLGQVLAARVRTRQRRHAFCAWDKMAKRENRLWQTESRLKCRLELASCAQVWQALRANLQTAWYEKTAARQWQENRRERLR
eukprot:3438728-Rhodomonas_salina.1